MRTAGADQNEWTQPEAYESPFAETYTPPRPDAPVAEAFAWSEALSPFADEDTEAFADEADSLLSEALAELRDEAFHEAVAFLA